MRTRRLGAALTAIALAACNKTPAPSAPPGAAPKGAATATVVARYAGKQITLEELDQTLGKELHELRRQGLEKMIVQALLKTEATKAGKSEGDFVREVAEKAVPRVTDEDVRKVFEEHKDQLGGRSFESLKALLEPRVLQQKRQEAAVAYFAELKKKAQVQILLPVPRVQVAAAGPAKGPVSAPVTIVEFSDFECPYCSQARKTVDRVLAAYPGKIRLVFRDYPLPFHDNARKAAEAGLCADDQGKFWEMHDRMFDEPRKLSVADLKAAAKALGLDAAKFDECLDSGKFGKRVDESIEAGRAAGVTGTPAFFINGRLLSGALPFEKFKELVDEEMQGK